MRNYTPKVVAAICMLCVSGFVVSCTKDDDKGSKGGIVIPDDAVNLSDNGTSNCYIVAPNSVAVFDAGFKGNSTVETIDNATGATLVWQDANGLIESVGYAQDSKQILVKTGDYSGNALVAAVDSAGIILWSWHLWVVDYDPNATSYTTTANASGTQWTFMDRNLGATTAAPEGFGSHGLLYQWGRKDPFPGAATYTVMNDDYSYQKDGEPELYDIDGNILDKTNALAEYHGSIEKSIANPRVFYAMTYNYTGEYDEYGSEIVENDPKSGDWCDVSNDDYWGGESMGKTIYDPCPVGYKVPVCDADGNTPYAWLAYASMKWDTTNFGATQNDQWFPATGTRVYASGGLDFPESGSLYSGLWIGTKGATSSDLTANPTLYGQYMFIINGKRTFKVNKDRRSQGMSVRCVKE